MTGHVECSECGHPLERHVAGCDLEGCACAEVWSLTEIRAIRRRNGLPATWRAGTV